MLRAALLIGTTWTTLSFLFCFAWARAFTVLSDTRSVGQRRLRVECSGVNRRTAGLSCLSTQSDVAWSALTAAADKRRAVP
jgi:hypothetical protein